MPVFEPPRSKPHTVVSAIIPARNEEASIARTVESVAAQAEVDEVIVVDDGSTDATSRILSELTARVAKLKVIAAGALPDGWVGKNHAAWVGAAESKGDWLLFTDADTFHLPGAMRRALADALEHDAALLSYSPEQEMETWWERALIPFVYCRLAARFSFERVNDPTLPDAAANGQFILVRREVYEKLGGHQAVRGEILEDVALARRVKAARCGVYFTAPAGVVQTRMYRSFGAMWEGWTKNLFPLIGGTATAALKELAGITPVLETLLLAWFVWFGWHTGQVDWAWAVGIAVLMLSFRTARYGRVLYENHYPQRFIQYYVPAAGLYTLILIGSWWKNSRGQVVWKGRGYLPGLGARSER
ncbi:MAG: glycosyltransferase family 2 protein [Candidatus Acidiferrales bacterium]